MRQFLFCMVILACVLMANQSVAVTNEQLTTIPTEGLAAEGRGQWQTAISIYLAVLLKEPSRADLWLRIATIAQRIKNYPLVVDAYQHAAMLQPDNAALYKTLSEFYSVMKQPEKALAAINRAVTLKPYDKDYLLARAAIANWNKDVVYALDSYQRLLALSRIENSGLDLVQIYSEIAGLQSQLHDYSASVIAYQKAITLNPHNALLYQQLSQTYAQTQDAKHALLAIEQALALEPHNLDFLLAKAQIATWLQEYPLALATYQQVLQFSPRNPAALQGIKVLERRKQMERQLGSPANLSPFDRLIAEANNEAVQHHYAAAATYLKQAIAIEPNNASLYKKLSELYATASLAKQAIQAIDKAVVIDPNNVDYWQARAKLASWVEDKNKTLASYQRILTLRPHDEDALLNVAHSLAWLGRTDDAIEAYETLLTAYPNNAEGWLQYADVLTWTRRFIDATQALNRYRALGGKTREYQKTKARIFALAGYYQSSVRLNEPLLHQTPTDPYLLSTEVTAKIRENQTNQALYYLNRLNKIKPNDREVNNLNQIVNTPLKSNLNLEADYSGASDTTRITDIPVGVQYFVTPTTSILMQGLYEYATASVSSGLEAANGHGSIFDESARVGFTTQFNMFNIKALAGGLKIQNENNHGIYDLLINGNAGEKAQVTFESSRDLFRPYLVPQTPRLISLQVMESRNGMSMIWQPALQKYMNVVFSHSTLSDNNGYWHANLWPKARVFGAEHWLVTLGVDGDFWHFRRRAMNGYYSPRHFDGYEGTIEVYYAHSENIGLSLQGGFGIQKDELFPHFCYEEDLAFQLFLGIFTEWELSVRGGFTLRNNPTPRSYKYATLGAVLTRRF